MRRNWTIRGLSIPLALLAVLLPSRSEAHGDPWPLVNAAENAAWGTLIHRSTSPTCELLVVAPGLSAPVSIPPVRLANPVVGLPEGTEVLPGQRGLFLWIAATPTRCDLAALDGTVLVGGFLPGNPPVEEREAVLRAIGGGAEGVFTEVDARRLLESSWSPARAIALGWIRDREVLGAELRSALDASLATEDEGWLRGALETYLQRGWSLPPRGLPELVTRGEDPVLVDLALHAIERQGDLATRAELLLAWRGAPIAEKQRLLAAYARLRLEESVPWWQEALASEDSRLWETALAEMGRGTIPGAIDAYRAVLRSADPALLRPALEGLARARTAEAATLLREFRATRDPEDPLARQAERHLTEPARHRSRPRVDAPAGEGRR